MKNLTSLHPGERAIVVSIQESELRPKLMEMGLIPGKTVTYLFKAPFGDPIAIDFGDYVLSLRLDEAKLVEVKSENA